MKAIVETPYYDWDGRKYIELNLEGLIRRIKVPYRYGRVMCRVEGLKTIQELQKGDEVEVELQKKVWDGVEHWVIFSLRT
jgi:hypothetical protein